MRVRASLHGSEIDAYILTSYDDHMNDDIADHDKRRQFISGFSGPTAVVAVRLECNVSHETLLTCSFRGFSLSACRLHCTPLHSGRTTNFWRKPIRSWIAIGRYSATTKSRAWPNGCDPNWHPRHESVPIRTLCHTICGSSGRMNCIRNSFVSFGWIGIWSIWCGMIDRSPLATRCTFNRICMRAKNGKQKYERCAIIWCNCDAMPWLWHRSPKLHIYWICAAQICHILPSSRYV